MNDPFNKLEVDWFCRKRKLRYHIWELGPRKTKFPLLTVPNTTSNQNIILLSFPFPNLPNTLWVVNSLLAILPCFSFSLNVPNSF